MSKIKLKQSDKKDLYLYSTDVENFFINEFMPAAPGDYVKLYLYALMHAQYGIPMDMRETAHTLGMTEKDIKEAWTYWCKNGIAMLEENKEGEMEELVLVSQAEMFYGNRFGKASSPIVEQEAVPRLEEQVHNGQTVENEQAEEASFEAERMKRIVDAEIRYLYDQYEEATGRTISQKEIKKISSAIKEYGISSDIMSYAIKYSIEIDKYSIDYMFTVALRWWEEGLRDVSQVKEYLDRYSKRNEYYGMIFREMGFSRLPNPSDKAMMDRWFDELGCTISEVLDACRASAGLREPTLKYVAKVIENRILEAGGIDTRKEAIRKNERAAQRLERTSSVTAAVSDNGRQTGESNKAHVSIEVLNSYYEYLRSESERLQNAHIDELTSELLEMRELYEKENRLNDELLSGRLLQADKQTREARRAERRELEQEKKQILISHGYSEDYLDRNYKCKICGDTGSTDEGMVCVCRKARSEEAYTWYQTIRKKKN